MSAHSTTRDVALTASARARIAVALTAEIGLLVPDWVLEARVGERIAALGLAREPDVDPGEAYADLVDGPEGERERARLIELLRVGETRFFRHAAHVHTVIDHVAPRLLSRRQDARGRRRPVRAWSAGCATGEEAYTLALVLGVALPGVELEVLGTDLSEPALAVARAGVYSAAAVARVPQPWRHRGFTSEDGQWRVREEIRCRVRFARHNLMEERAPAGWEAEVDLIWCRNVFIYFTPEARRQVAGGLADRLSENGFLFVGYAESLRDVDRLEAVRTPEAVVYRRASGTRGQGRPEAAALGTSLDASRGVSAGAIAVGVGGQGRARAGADAAAPAVAAMVGSGVAAMIGAGTGAGTAAAPVGAETPPVRLRLCGDYGDGERLAGELRAVMAAGAERVEIELDGASFLGDAAAAVLRRALSAARAHGRALILHAERAGTRRWLRRHGLRSTEHESERRPSRAGAERGAPP
ncbi:CheR family methyltransferase [Haliangium sp.]|uniref:CheR family methyltransferase n=1 Tax=Haliangium sp. TaxID=2663208 RepID=UPI003D0CD073